MTTAPFFTEIAEAPSGAESHWLTASDGVRLRVVHWRAQAAKGTVLLFPGRTEYIEKYGRDVALLTEAGFAVAVIDWRGQGLSDRLSAPEYIGHVERFLDFQKDVRALCEHVKAVDLPAPLYLLAHSMGGAIGLRALHLGLPVNAAAFSAPMWGIEMPSALRVFARVASTFACLVGRGHNLAAGRETETVVMHGEFMDNALTNDLEQWGYMRDQANAHPELTLGGPSYRWILEAMKETDALSRLAPPKVPTVTFLGDQEAIVDAERIRSKMAEWTDGTLVPLRNAKHETLMELPVTRGFVFKTIIAHFAAHP